MRFCPMCGSKNQDDNIRCNQCNYTFSVRNKTKIINDSSDSNEDNYSHVSVNEIVNLNCTCCGGTTKISSVSNGLCVNCDFCGSKLLISENSDVVKERIRKKSLEEIAEKEIELAKIKKETEDDKRYYLLLFASMIVLGLMIIGMLIAF